MAQVTKTILRDRGRVHKDMVGQHCVLRKKRDGERTDWYVWEKDKDYEMKGFPLNTILNNGSHDIAQILNNNTLFDLGDFLMFNYLLNGDKYQGYGHIRDFVINDPNDHSDIVVRVETHTLDPYLPKVCDVNIDKCTRLMSFQQYNTGYPKNDYKRLCEHGYMSRKHHFTEHPLTVEEAFDKATRAELQTFTLMMTKEQKARVRYYQKTRVYDEKVLHQTYKKISGDLACSSFGGFEEAFLIALKSAPYRSKILLLL